MSHIENLRKESPISEDELNAFRRLYVDEMYVGTKISNGTWIKIAETLLFQIKRYGYRIGNDNYSKLLSMYNMVERVLKKRGCPKTQVKNLFNRFKAKKNF